MMGGYDDNGDNLGQLEVVLGATEMPRNIIARELLGNIFLPTNCTNGHEWLQWIKWRPGRSHELSLMQ